MDIVPLFSKMPEAGHVGPPKDAYETNTSSRRMVEGPMHDVAWTTFVTDMQNSKCKSKMW